MFEPLAAQRKVCPYTAMDRFAAKVLELIESLGTNQNRVAHEIGVDPTQFGYWLKDKEKNPRNLKPTAEQLLKLARRLRTTMDYLWDDSLDEATPGLLTDGEEILLDVAREMGARRAVAILRKQKDTEVPEPSPGPYRTIAERDETQLAERQFPEDPPASAVQAEGKDVGTKTNRRPGSKGRGRKKGPASSPDPQEG